MMGVLKGFVDSQIKQWRFFFPVHSVNLIVLIIIVVYYVNDSDGRHLYQGSESLYKFV